MAQHTLDRITLAVAAITRAARENRSITVAGLQDELERGDIDGWSEIARRYSLTFSEWSAAMERAIEYLSKLQVVTVRTNDELRALNLSFYTLCKLANVLECVDPTQCLEHRLTHPAFASNGWRGELTLDKLGNFVDFR